MLPEPKKILPEEEMRIKVEDAIRCYMTSQKGVTSLSGLADSLNDIYNEACPPGHEYTRLLEWVASFPDN